MANIDAVCKNLNEEVTDITQLMNDLADGYINDREYNIGGQSIDPTVAGPNGVVDPKGIDASQPGFMLRASTALSEAQTKVGQITDMAKKPTEMMTQIFKATQGGM